MAKRSSDYELWRAAAEKVERSDNPLKIPYDVALAEAVSAAAWVGKYWDAGPGRPGLVGVEKRLPKKTADEVLSLVRAVQEAQTRLLLLVDPVVADRGARARFVVDELESALEFLLDDDQDEPADEQLANIRQYHSQDGQRSSALAQALRDYAALADELRGRLVALDASFDGALIGEARALADALTEQTKADTTSGAEAQAAAAMRNKLLTLLTEKVRLIRKTGAHVFRAQPEIVREVTSSYERRRRASARQKAPVIVASAGG